MDNEGAPHRVVIGLGSNLGDRMANLRDAITRFTDDDRIVLVRTSPVYETDPLGPPQGPYLNAAFAVDTTLPLRALLDRALEVERLMGRERRLRWGPRVIDLDILWSDGAPLHEPGLTVPHPELTARAFALLPAIDVLDPVPAQLADARRRLGVTLRPLGDPLFQAES